MLRQVKYAGIYGLFEGVKKANGVRDLAAIATLKRQACGMGGGLVTFQVPRTAGPLALGWTLSRPASNRLTTAAHEIIDNVTNKKSGGVTVEQVFKMAQQACKAEGL